MPIYGFTFLKVSRRAFIRQNNTLFLLPKSELGDRVLVKPLNIFQNSIFSQNTISSFTICDSFTDISSPIGGARVRTMDLSALIAHEEFLEGRRLLEFLSWGEVGQQNERRQGNIVRHFGIADNAFSTGGTENVACLCTPRSITLAEGWPQPRTTGIYACLKFYKRQTVLSCSAPAISSVKDNGIRSDVV